MNLRGILQISTSLMLVYASFIPSFAQAEDYVKTSQINVANGVAGLNGSKQVTVDGVVLPKPEINGTVTTTKNIFFATGSQDGNNQTVYMFYNPYNSNIVNSVDGRLLDKDTFYFTNNKYGNKYRFDGNVKAEGLLIRDNPIIYNYEKESQYSYSPPIQGGYELLSPYNSNSKSSLIFLSKRSFDNKNTKPNTLMIGGQTRNAIVGIKATCQNTGSGDLGGSCYQFMDMSGPHWGNRSGSGWTDGVNMEIDSQDNSPLDAIGGNQLVDRTANSDSAVPYEVQGIILYPTTNVNAGVSNFKVSGTFGCGMGGGSSHCQMTIKDTAENIIFNGKVTPGKYDPETKTTELQLANNATLPTALTSANKVEIKYYSADGIAYGIKFQQNGVIIYPALSSNEQNLIHDRMAIWTNIANGMQSTEANSVDKPNYYLGYNQNIYNQIFNQTKFNTQKDAIQKDSTKTESEKSKLLSELDKQITLNTYSTIEVNMSASRGSGEKVGWADAKSLRNFITSGKYTSTIGIPGQITNDQYDYTIQYMYPTDGINNNLRGKAVYNSNFHQYSQPTLFFGLSDKNFNIYTLQRHNSSADSITREYDNEWDFWMNPKHDYEVSTRGLTMTWGGYEHLFAKDSYMMLLTGADAMPKGLLVEHVARAGGLEIGTDAGFGVYKWAYPMQELNKSGQAQTIAALGQAKTKTGSYQLISYMSNDGEDHNYDTSQVDPTNNSLHLGLTKLNIQHNYKPNPKYVSGSTKEEEKDEMLPTDGDDGQTLEKNISPTCDGLNFGSQNCSVLGQVIFDPLGYKGGIALGSGQGKNTKLGLIVDKNGHVTFNNSIVGPTLTESAFYTAEEKKVGGQGSMQSWNMYSPGNAHTEFTNVDPLGNAGGFDFYDIKSFTPIQNATPVFRLGKTETFFDVKPTMKQGITIPSSSPISFGTGSQDGNNQTLYMFYNPYNSNKVRELSDSELARIGKDKLLNQDTFYFTNLRYGNKFAFDGNVNVSDMISAKTIKLSLSTPSSSSAACTAGEFKDDINYHYVCVANNKWKRVALSDF